MRRMLMEPPRSLPVAAPRGGVGDGPAEPVPCRTLAWTRRNTLGVLLVGALSSLHAATPRRIVSVGGALTETLFALGAEREIVGVDTTSLFPAAAEQLPKVGYARTLSAEGVLSLSPTLLVCTGEAGPPMVLRQLRDTGLAIETFDPAHRIEGVVQATRRLGSLVGRAGEGEALAARIEAGWQGALGQIQRRTEGKPPLRVLFVLSHSMNQLRVSGRDTGADAMIRYAGAVNAFGDVTGYKPLTPEAAIAAAPDVILVTDQGLTAAGGVDGFLRVPGLASTPAGRARRVLSLDALLLLGFGPRQPQALAQLGTLLYGDRA